MLPPADCNMGLRFRFDVNQYNDGVVHSLIYMKNKLFATRCFPGQPSILNCRAITLTRKRLFAIRPDLAEPESNLKDRLKEAPGTRFSNLCSILDSRPQEYSSSMVLAAAVQLSIACMEPDATKRYNSVLFRG